MEVETENKKYHTSEYNHSKTPLSVSENTTSQQHFFIIQRVFVVSPV